MSRTVTLRVSDEHYALFRACAEKDNRPLSNLIETAALLHLQEAAFMSTDEMAGIRRDKALVARLQKGSREVRSRKGRMIG